MDTGNASLDFGSACGAAKAVWRTIGQEVEALEHAELQQLHAHLLRVPTSRRFEACFETGEVDLVRAGEVLAGLATNGWVVNAVVPLSLLGEAHEAWRSCQVELQGWWRADDGIVRFGRTERA